MHRLVDEIRLECQTRLKNSQISWWRQATAIQPRQSTGRVWIPDLTDPQPKLSTLGFTAAVAADRCVEVDVLLQQQHESMDSPVSNSCRPYHQDCSFTGRAICRCLCGASVALQSGSTEAAEHMRRARAAWRMLHRSATAASVNDEPRVIWLPKLVKQTPAQAQQHRWNGGAKARQTPTEAAAAARHSVAAGAAAVQRAEAVALAAAQRAASLAASAGVGYQVPQALLALGAKPADEEAQTVKHAEHTELERQVAAVRAAQEARQQAASAALRRAASAHAAGPAQLQRHLISQQARRGPPSRQGRTGPGSGAQLGEGAEGSTGGGLSTRQHPGPGLPPSRPAGGHRLRGPTTTPPPPSQLLTMADFTPSLQGRLVQTLWPEGGRWWPAVVLRASPSQRSCALSYETGDEKSVDLAQLIQAGEVAWLHEPHPPQELAPPQGAAGQLEDTGGQPAQQQQQQQQQQAAEASAVQEAQVPPTGAGQPVQEEAAMRGATCPPSGGGSGSLMAPSGSPPPDSGPPLGLGLGLGLRQPGSGPSRVRAVSSEVLPPDTSAASPAEQLPAHDHPHKQQETVLEAQQGEQQAEGGEPERQQQGQQQGQQQQEEAAAEFGVAAVAAEAAAALQPPQHSSPASL
ncbi:hypothetical protein ACK3TF_005982 [Chlorella vulgaris]